MTNLLWQKFRGKKSTRWSTTLHPGNNNTSQNDRKAKRTESQRHVFVSHNLILFQPCRKSIRLIFRWFIFVLVLFINKCRDCRARGNSVQRRVRWSGGGVLEAERLGWQHWAGKKRGGFKRSENTKRHNSKSPTDILTGIAAN